YTIEQGARIRRREIFRQLVASGKAQRVVTAHHLADNVESVLMHIFRGSGLKGLCGMSVDDGTQLRPMLECSRQSIDEYIKVNAVPFVQDSSNESLDYTRNKLRREIMPLIKAAYGGAENNILRLAKRAQELFEYIDGLSKEFSVKDKVAYIPLSVLEKDKAIASQTVVNAVDCVTTRVDLTDKHIKAVVALKDGRNGASVDLPFGLKAHRQSDCVALALESKCEYSGKIDGYGEYDLGDKILLLSPTRKDGLVCDLDKLKGCEIRNRRTGDSFKRFKGGNKSLGDFLTDIKAPKRLRDSVIVIAKGSVVYLLPEYEIADCVKVEESTQNKAYITIINKTAEEV
ncbi:MAG: tRNA lysidine(34) synthetase TilS, partial [Clostridia bacterium]|nr:tRNA lysidine(34) synthetase TilS [Clostridia bacterium]